MTDNTDIDECASDSDLCDENTVCTNTAGSYSCNCSEGYERKDQQCTGLSLHYHACELYLQVIDVLCVM